MFTNGISTQIAAKLEALGITVQGERVIDSISNFESDSEISDSDQEDICEDVDKRLPDISDLSTKHISTISKVNLDVSAMLAYCSSVTNGSAHLYDFHVAVLKQQAEWERLRPQKPILDSFFKGE